MTFSNVSRVVVFGAYWTGTSNKKENTPDISLSEYGLCITFVALYESRFHTYEGKFSPSGDRYGYGGDGVALRVPKG